MEDHGRNGVFSIGFTGPRIWLADRLGLRLSSAANEGSAEGRNRSSSGRRRVSSGRNSGRIIDEDEDDDETSDCYVTDEDEEIDSEEDEVAGYKVESSDTEDQEQISLKDHALGHEIIHRTAASSASARFGRVKPGESVNTVSMLHGREMNVSGNMKFSRAECCHVASKYLPDDGPTVVEQSSSHVYTGQFSADGSLFVAGFQDKKIRIYNVEKQWMVQKDVKPRNSRWTVTDTALSPDQRFLVYASITPVVHLVNVGSESGGVQSLANITDIHEGLDFSSDPESVFGIWSLQFSHDGREIVAGSSDKSIYVYDLEANKSTFRVVAHKNDVNAVIFADKSCQLIFSGSDDNYCKVWDRRCFSQKSRLAGTLEGHLEGITFLDTFGDGRHFISNSKDQSIKLWDIRKMSTATPPRPRPRKVPSFRWDYRWGDYPGRGKNLKHPYDQSVMTYKGHSVLKTLIRCYVSPMHSTGQKFIYTGSKDGTVYIYDVITGKLVSRLVYHTGPVRDVSWHPTEPVLISSSWDRKIAKWENLRGEMPSAREGFRGMGIPHRGIEDYFDSD